MQSRNLRNSFSFGRPAIIILTYLSAIFVSLVVAESADTGIPRGWTEKLSVHGKSGDCICSFHGKLPESGILFARPPETREVEAIVSNILNFAGLAPNFRVVEIDRDNAVAMIRGGKRILGFGKSFLRGLSDDSKGSSAEPTSERLVTRK